MKLIYITAIIFICSVQFGRVTAQVGINTSKPLGMFDIDTKGNNDLNSKTSESELRDDVIIDASLLGGLNMSVGGKVPENSSAQLTLLDPNKAILLNRVSLLSLKDTITIPKPTAGMWVYNTSTLGEYPDDITPGYYYFNGVTWYRFQTEKITSELYINKLQTYCQSTPVDSFDSSNAPMQANLADFGLIKIKQAGAYIFSLRLYGIQRPTPSGIPGPSFSRSKNYIYMMKNGSTKIDQLEINTVTFGDGAGYTYTANLQAVLEENDIVTFRLGQAADWYGWELVANPGLTANTTSLVYWKI